VVFAIEILFIETEFALTQNRFTALLNGIHI